MELKIKLPDFSLQGMADMLRVPLPLPTKVEAKAWDIKPMYTPDLYQLEKRPFSLLFEYGELLMGLPRHKSLLNQVPLALAYTYENMALWRKNLGKRSFALAMNWHPENRPVPHSRIQGHIYQVPSLHLLTLDNYRSNGVSFKRKRMPLVLPTGELAEAWGYVACKDEWAPQIDWDYNFYRRNGGSDFSLVSMFYDMQNTNRKYYRFTEFDVTSSRLPIQDPLKHFSVRHSDTHAMVKSMDLEFNKQSDRVSANKEPEPTRPFIVINTKDDQQANTA